MASEIFVPYEHPGRPPMATEVRSTIIVSSMQALRSHGLFDRYVEKIDPAHRDALLSLIAGKWIPVDLGAAHYRAADRLGLDPATIARIGGDVAERTNKTGFSLVLKISKEGGVTPWTALASTPRLRTVNWKGTDVGIFKLGPKEARFDHVGVPYASIPYYQQSFGGFLRALLGLLSPAAYARYEPERSTPTSICYRLSWV